MKESNVNGIVRLSVVMSVVIGFVHGAMAAEDATPRISIVAAGADELLADVKYIVGLTNEKERKQSPVLEDYFDIFLEGIDRTMPIRIDMLLDAEEVRYMSSFPITNIKAFRENLEAFGIDSKRKSPTLYELEMNKDPFGWMRYKKPYATIAETRGEVPLSLPDPRKAVESLLAKKFDLGAEIRNTADGQDKRKESFKKVREELMAAVKQKEDESKEDFELRKMFTTHQLNEAERFFVEASQITLGWTTDAAKKVGRLELKLAPIADTDLEKTIKLFGQKPSHFANVKKSENSVLSVRINHPLDQMRTNHFLEMWDRLRDQLKQRFDVSETSTDDEKANRKKIADLLFDILKEGAKMGVVDGFVEVEEHAADKHTAVAGIRAADGNAMIEIVKLLEAAKMGQKVQVGLDKQGDVSIHKVVLPDDKQHVFKDFLADDGIVYVGTSQETVWFAAGEGALKALKQAIEAVEEPNAGKADAPFVDFYGRIGPWLKLLDKYRAKTPAQKAAAPKPKKKKISKKKTEEGEASTKAALGDLAADRDALRKLALEAFQPKDDVIDDVITVRLERIENRVEGRMEVQPGILRFVGKLMAKFSAENLDEE